MLFQREREKVETEGERSGRERGRQIKNIQKKGMFILTRLTLTENFLPQLKHCGASLSCSHFLSLTRDCITCTGGSAVNSILMLSVSTCMYYG